MTWDLGPAGFGLLVGMAVGAGLVAKLLAWTGGGRVPVLIAVLVVRHRARRSAGPT